ncbi:hypothetical protein [Blastochloris tepida]|uniref:Uncharacterized protein n=1 Tax=Blastochloris tepida TaxID=2233851 RepID=A0A348FY32_9HYPH|nr:hypothetical protein [Blastochloris tepida]BBF92215.1 hypothetical protein BLTE_09000 [Blastochloris tepida]
MTAIPNEITSAADTAVSLPDLAARFAELYPRWRDYKNRRHAEHEEFEARVLAATGMTFDEAEARGGILFENYRAVRKQVINDDAQRGLLDDDDPEDVIWDEINGLASSILKHPALSMDDVRLQARAVAVFCLSYWTDVKSIDGLTWHMRRVIENFAAVAGVELLPGLDGVESLDAVPMA